jgi:DnaK suppressor protein
VPNQLLNPPACASTKVNIMIRQQAWQQLRSALVLRRDAIRGVLQTDLEMLTELARRSGDSAQHAVESTRERITSQLAEVESHELARIDKALRKMKDGTYGDCEGCGKAIPLARLRALPYATLCIACQEKLEESGCRDWSELTQHAYDSAEPHS